MSRQKTTILLSVALAVVVLLLALFILLPYYVKKRIIDGISSSSGLKVSCGDVSSRGFWLKFHDFSICSEDCSEGDPLVIDAGLIRVMPDFMSLLKGKAKPDRIEVSHLNLRVDLSSSERSEKISNVLARLGKIFKSVKGEGGGPGRSGGEGRKLEPAAITMNYVNLDIALPGAVRMTSTGTSISDYYSSGEPGEISLGYSVLEGPDFSVEVDDLRFKIGASASSDFPSIRNVSLIRPTIKAWLPEDSLKVKMPSGRPAGESGKEGGAVEGKYLPVSEDSPGEGPEAGSLPDKFFAGLRDAFDILPLLVHGTFQSTDIQMFGGTIIIYEKGPENPVWEFKKVAGSASFDPKNNKLGIDAFGDLDFLPFKIKIEGDGEVIDIEADMPVIVLKHLQKEEHEEDILDLTAAKGDLNGKLTVNLKNETIHFEGRFGIRELDINYYRFAQEPVRSLYFSFNGTLEWTFNPFLVSVGESDMSISGIPFFVKSFSYTKDEGNELAVMKGVLPVTDCQKLFSALPFEMRSNLAGFRFGGVMGADFDTKIDFVVPDNSDIDFKVENHCKVVEEGDMMIAKFNKTFVHEVEDKLGKHKFIMGPGSDSWVNYEDISPYIVSAAVTCEDGAFYHHKGVSAFAIKRAVKRDLELKGFYHGASTITMQLSKNLFLSREKTISRKLQEIIISWWLERSMDKDNIMELYLNVVEFGPEIYGVRNASIHYFDKEPGNLTILEAVFLAKMLPNPVARYKYYKEYLLKGQLSPKWRGVLERVTGKMYTRGYISKEEHDGAIVSEMRFFTGGDDDDDNPYD